eukprot:403369410
MEAVTQDIEYQQPADLVQKVIALEQEKYDSNADEALWCMFQEDEDDGTIMVKYLSDTCPFCKQKFISNDKIDLYTEKIQINEEICLRSKDFHYAHQNCFTKAASEKIATRTDKFCLECNLPLTDQIALQLEIDRQNVIKAIVHLTKAQIFTFKMREIINIMDKQDLHNEFNLILCKQCENIIDISDQLKEKETLAQFYQVSDQSIQIDTQVNQKQKFMVQCGDEICAYSFCLECKVEPYHKNYSCLEYQTYLDNKQCRFCQKIIGKNFQTISDEKAFKYVCNDQACVELMSSYCDRVHGKCGHFCHGIAKEAKCIPCLDPSCVLKNQELTFGICSEDDCQICYTNPLNTSPVVKLKCKHLFHEECLYKILQNKWSGNRINFGFMNCPICSQLIESENSVKIQSFISELYEIRGQVENVAHNTALREEIYTADEYLVKYKDPSFYQQLEYAMLKMAMYQCYQCEAYFCGG